MGKKQPEYKTELINITELKLNPNNPRLIKDDKFAKLVQSIKDFPEMLEIRPIVVNEDMIILGGNMRFRACKEAGLKQVPVIKLVGLSVEKQREFLIKDNVSGGEWDWNMLANEWDEKELNDWGLDLPNELDLDNINEKQQELKNAWFLNIEFQNEKECEKWYDKLLGEGLICKIVQ